MTKIVPARGLPALYQATTEAVGWSQLTLPWMPAKDGMSLLSLPSITFHRRYAASRFGGYALLIHRSDPRAPKRLQVHICTLRRARHIVDTRAVSCHTSFRLRDTGGILILAAYPDPRWQIATRVPRVTDMLECRLEG